MILEPAEEDPECSPTLPMPIHVPISMQISTGKLTGWARSDVETAAIIHTWEGRYAINMIQANEEDDQLTGFLMCPLEQPMMSVNQQKVIPCWFDGTLTLHVHHSDENTCRQVQTQTGKAEIFDAFGRVEEDTVMPAGMLCQDFYIRRQTAEDPVAFIVAAFHASNVTICDL